MGFDQSAVTRIYPPSQDSRGLRLSWDSAAPAGTFFQVYVARRLAWFGVGRTCVVPVPEAKSRIDVGAVGANERDVDFSASLVSAPQDRAVLSWQGGGYLGDGFAGFRVYQAATAGGAVDYARPVAEIPVAIGAEMDGFGFGPFGSGGFGFAASSYSWASAPLAAGTWSFAVVSFDAAGNEGPAVTGDVAIVAPPAPPARATDRTRLRYAYDSTSHEVTLSWLASPG